MSGYGYPPGGNPPQYAPMYPSIYNPSNAGVPGLPGFPAPGQPGFPVPGQAGYPGQPYPSQANLSYGHPPAAMSYPTVNAVGPTAPPGPGFYPGLPNITPTPAYGAAIDWVPTTPNEAIRLSDRAVVAGYEGYDNSPLWVIRARFEGDLIPGKLAAKHNAAYVPWAGKENAVINIEVLCARPECIQWVATQGGNIPPKAIVAGNTSSGESLYVGRGREQGSLTPGKVHPSHKVLYLSFAGQERAHANYEILCTV